MSKKSIVGAALAFAFVAAPFMASAASVTNPTSIFNGQGQVYGNAGTNVQANFQVDVPAGQVLHAVRTKVDGQATVCTAVGPFEGAQTVSVAVNLTLPPNTNNGGYSLVGDLYYTDTLPQAQAMTGNLACTDNVTGSHSNLSAYNQPTPVNVLPSSGTGTGSSSVPEWQSAINALAAQISALAAKINAAPTTPAPSTACAALAVKLSGTTDNTYTDANARLQGFLISEGIDIPAIKAGASYGYKGPQTRAGVSAFQSSHACI